MSVRIVMNNRNKFNVEGTLGDWIEKIKNEKIIEITVNNYVVSQNISEVYEKIEKVSKKKK